MHVVYYVARNLSRHVVHRRICRGEAVALGRRFMVLFAAKEVCQWQANVGIAAARAMATAASTVRTRSTSIATTKSTASGAVAQVTAIAAYTRPTRYTATAPARTSASGAARRRTAPVASIRRRTATRSNVIRLCRGECAAGSLKHSVSLCLCVSVLKDRGFTQGKVEMV